jgi:hypothetical protein
MFERLLEGVLGDCMLELVKSDTTDLTLWHSISWLKHSLGGEATHQTAEISWTFNIILNFKNLTGIRHVD